MALGFKTGGRQKGVGNKPNPTKQLLQNISMAYITPRPQTAPDGRSPRILELRTSEGNVYQKITLADPNGQPLVLSDFDIDLMLMEPKDRAIIHVKLLRYHTPQMQAVSAEVSLSGDITATIEDRLRDLADID